MLSPVRAIVVALLLLMAAETVRAQSATTGAATGVTDIAATLNGTMNPGGGSWYLYFQWGATTAYGNSVGTLPSSAFGSNLTALTGAPTGLQPNTTYHYRLMAETVSTLTPTYFGQDMTFTTGPPSSAPTINGAITTAVIEQMHATIAVPAVLAGGSAATVVLQYGTSTAYGSTQSVTTVPTGTWASNSYIVIQGLTPGATYHVRCQASNGQGATVTPDLTFTTLSPPVVTTDPATQVTDLSAVLNGTLTQNGNYIDGIYLEYGATTSYGQEVPVSGSGVDPQALSVTATNLVPSTLYHCRLVLEDDETGYVLGNDQVFTTAAAATPPTITGNISISEGSPSTVTPYVSSVYSGSSPATIIFEYGTSTAYGSVAQVPGPMPLNTSDSVQMTITGLAPGTTYHMRCTATNGQGSVSTPDTTFTTMVAPILLTNAASGVTDLNAVFNGTVNPENMSLTIEFQYGATAAYGDTQTASNPYVSGSSVVAESTSPQGLVPNTTYHYRIIAIDWQNTTYYGPDMTFTMAAAATPPTVGTVTTYGIGTTTASVQCYPISAGSSAATVIFDYGPTTSYGSSVTVPETLPIGAVLETVDATLTGLAQLSPCHVRCRVMNNEGTVTSPDITFTTYGIPVVTTGPATNVTDLTATLSGSVTPNGPSTTGYLYFDYGTDTNYGTTLSATPDAVLSSSLTPFTLAATGLLPNTTYHYRAKAYYPFGGVYYYGPDVTFTTAAPATPPTVSTEYVTEVTATSAVPEVVTVTAGSSDASVIFEYGTSTAYGSSIASVTPTIPLGTFNGASATLTGLLPNTTYHVRCTATNAQGSTSSADVTFTTLSAPVLITSPQYAASDLTATVNGSATPNESNFYDGYSFDWGTDTTYGSTVSATGTDIGPYFVNLTATVTGLTPNTTYHYRVKGFSYSDNNWYYGQDQTLTTGPPNTPPNIITGGASPITTTSMYLSTESLETGSSDTTVSYEYGLDTTYGTTAVYPTPISLGQSYYYTGLQGLLFEVQISGLTPGATYHFRAKAVNNEGTSYGQDNIFITPAAPIVTTTAATNVGTVTATLNGTLQTQGVLYNTSFDYGPTTDYGSNILAFYPFTLGGGGITLGTTVTLGTTITLGGTTTTTGVLGGILVLNGGSTNTLGTGSGSISVLSGSVNGVSVIFSSGTGSIGITTTGTSGGTIIFNGSPSPPPPDGTDDSGAITITGSGGITGITTLNSNGGIIIGNPVLGNPYGTFSPFSYLTGLTASSTYHYRLKATDSAGNTYYGADMTFTTIGPDALAQSWRQQYFGSPGDSGAASDTASPSGDGIPNLIKYALGLDPTVSSSGSMPQPMLQDFNGLTYLTYTFQRDSSMTDLTYAVQAADSPGGPWTTVASSVNGAPTTGPGFVTENLGATLGTTILSLSPTTVYTVEVHDTVSTTDAPRRFMRLQVTR